MDLAEISEKQLDILFKIIELYIKNGEPVGSRVLSKLNSVEISPASLRNIMMDLSEMSMVEQPHTSAGRIPTDQGYRVYVNDLMGKIDLDTIDEEPDIELQNRFGNIEDTLDDLLRGTAELIASESKMMGIVTSPRPVKSRMKIIEFLPMSDCQILVLIVTRTGMVTNRVIQVRENLNQDFLSGLSEYFNRQFHNKPLSAVREELLQALSTEMHSEPKKFARALRLGKKAFDLGFSGKLYIHGQTNFFHWPEFNDRESFAELFTALEDHDNLINLFDKEPETQDVITYIGTEHSIENLESCSLIYTNYGVNQNALGSVGVLGPKRLDYVKTIQLIKNVTNLLNKRLQTIVDE